MDVSALTSRAVSKLVQSLTDVHGHDPPWFFLMHNNTRSLYAGMGWAAHLAVKALDTSPFLAVRTAASSALTLWYAQFALNMAWTPLFFGAKKVNYRQDIQSLRA